MLVNIAPIEPGDAASPNLWNSRYAAITEVLNGNIDSDNIRNNSITREKIAAGSITSDKLNINKYIDDNGWTVSDYGSTKDWTIRKSGTIAIPPQTWKTIILPLPEGVTDVDNLIVSTMVRSGLTETILTLVPNSKKDELRLAMFNAHHSYNFNGPYRIDITAKQG